MEFQSVNDDIYMSLLRLYLCSRSTLRWYLVGYYSTLDTPWRSTNPLHIKDVTSHQNAIVSWDLQIANL